MIKRKCKTCGNEYELVKHQNVYLCENCQPPLFGDKPVQSVRKEKCIIWDIDGTVADRGTRHPFDYTTVLEDTPKKNIQFLYDYMRRPDRAEYGGEELEYIFITGRPESCRADTKKWLNDNNFTYNILFMRPDENKEQDARMKLQIYKEHIEPKYEVIAVFEDRKRVVDMWRDICHLTVLQVDKGEF